MFPSIKQMYNYIKMRNFNHSKDALGTYFDKNEHRLSMMRNASWYTCYHNKRVDGNWVLLNKSMIFNKQEEALYWVVKEIEKITN